MGKSFSKSIDLLSVIFEVRERYLTSLSSGEKNRLLTLARYAHLNTALLPSVVRGNHRGIGANISSNKRFEVVKKQSENHFRIRLCLNNQRDYLFRYAANYYRKKLNLHAFYNWKIAKLFSIGTVLRRKTAIPRTGTLSSVTDLSKKPEIVSDPYEGYFQKFDRFRIDS